MSDFSVSRRKFLRYSGAAASALAVPTFFGCGGGGGAESATISPGREASADFAADVDIELRAIIDSVPLLAGSQTTVMRYQATLLSGDASHLTTLPDNYLGPIITVRKGQNVRLRLVNELTEETVIHWHGLRVPEHSDGHPRFAVAPGDSYVYEFTIIDQAGTYWFHPHTHSRTGYQAYFGLAGLFVVTDDDEERLGLPGGVYDLPVIIQDRTFTSSNQLSYNAGSGMMGGMAGFFGDRILVNGAIDAALDLEANRYRLRMLNGSNARVYKLAWSDGTAMTVIGTDGGLLPQPLTRDYVTLAPGERADIYVDLSGHTVGSELRLVSLAYDGDAFGASMGGMMSPRPGIDVGAGFDVMTLRIARGATGSSGSLPSTLIPLAGYSLADAVTSRSFSLSMQHGAWRINGRTFVMEEVASDEKVSLGATEVWEYSNRSGQGVPHPMHAHGVRFMVLSRENDGSWGSAYGTVSNGFINDGWKDTVLVMPGEKVRVLTRFDSYSGLFLNHCHNLEHHDNGMMRNFLIE